MISNDMCMCVDVLVKAVILLDGCSGKVLTYCFHPSNLFLSFWRDNSTEQYIQYFEVKTHKPYHNVENTHARQTNCLCFICPVHTRSSRQTPG